MHMQGSKTCPWLRDEEEGAMEKWTSQEEVSQTVR